MASEDETRRRRRRLSRASRERLAGSADPAPDLREARPGEVYVVSATAPMEVLWAVAEVRRVGSDRGESRVRLVAADLFPGIGSRDVGVSGSREGPGVSGLRCGFALWADPKELGPSRGVGRLEERVHRRMLQKLESLAGLPASETPPHASASEREVDEDPEYEDWIEEGPSRALQALSALTTAQLPELPAWQRDLEAPGVLPLLRQIHVFDSRPHLGVERWALPPIAEGGWAVVMARGEGAGVRRALAPLLEHRRMGLGATRVRVLEYRSGESWSQWLARHGVAAGRPSWDRVPAFLLLVGSDEQIPRDVERHLGLEYAMGRLDLDRAQSYQRYVEKLLRIEQSGVPASEGLVGWETEPAGARRLLVAAADVGAVVVDRDSSPSAAEEPAAAPTAALGAMSELLRSGQAVGEALRPVAETYAGVVLRIEELRRQRSLGKKIGGEELEGLEAAAERLSHIRLFGDPSLRPGSGP